MTVPELQQEPQASEWENPRADHLHRLVCVYTATRPRIEGGTTVARFFDEPFRSHYRNVTDVMPCRVAAQAYAGDRIELPGVGGEVRVESVRTRVFAPRRGNLVVTLVLDFDGDLHAAIRLLDVTCHGRRKIRLGGQTVLAAAMAELPPADADCSYEPDVHQLLFPARLDRSVVDDIGQHNRGLLQSLVSRTLELGPRVVTYREPPDLNMCPDDVAAVKSGVSVLRTEKSDMESAATLSAVQLLASLSELRRIRRSASEALARFEAERPGEERDAKRGYIKERAALTDLTRELENLQLSLGFSVETYMNMRLLVPQHLVYQFHDSLSQALDMPEGVSTTDRMLTRLHGVVAATREWVAAKEREHDEGRNRLWAVAACAAIPLSLILAYLGINTEEVTAGTYSIFDLGHFGIAYLALLLLIAGTFGFAIYLERRRVKRAQ